MYSPGSALFYATRQCVSFSQCVDLFTSENYTQTCQTQELITCTIISTLKIELACPV